MALQEPDTNHCPSFNTVLNHEVLDKRGMLIDHVVAVDCFIKPRLFVAADSETEELVGHSALVHVVRQQEK